MLMQPSNPSLGALWQEWRQLIVLGSCVVGFVIFFQFWGPYRANLPIVPEYRRYLDHLATHSPRAQQYADAYYREHGRPTIASKHFEHVCAAMTTLAVEDGFTLQDYPDFPSEWCHERIGFFSELLQPQ